MLTTNRRPLKRLRPNCQTRWRPPIHGPTVATSNRRRNGLTEKDCRVMEGEWSTGTLNHWRKGNNRYCYFTPLFRESMVLYRSRPSAITPAVRGRGTCRLGALLTAIRAPHAHCPPAHIAVPKILTIQTLHPAGRLKNILGEENFSPPD
ncbi:hypothetical protein EVAR_64633_1 [Eumeta japonica]|uniref:Uncharacterized protein n=1 Tax=Eumeta variegata TaxID=151549 RepID=A0A4C1ZA66_EUMVA|nr:hypothetical protein EVAR_64633_1 [Eumeta japonica]